MTGMIEQITAAAEEGPVSRDFHSTSPNRPAERPARPRNGLAGIDCEKEPTIEGLEAHQFPAPAGEEKAGAGVDEPISEAAQRLSAILREYEEIESEEENRRRRIYRSRTITMLRRYMKYSIETGRLPSLLGQEFFRAKVTTYSVVTFEDRVIFVHDMERCLERLDEFSRQLIARHVLQEHDRWATARLLHCNEKTVRRLMPVAIDQLCEIMMVAGLMEKLDSIPEKSCQGGLDGEISVSDCEESENNF